MTNPLLHQQIKSCVKLGITSFVGDGGEHDLCCPKCESLGDLQSGGYLICPNDDCRVVRFFTG